MVARFIRQPGLVINTSQWSVVVDIESSTEIKELASDQFLLEPKVLSEMVGLESDGLIVEVDFGLPSYWLTRRRTRESSIYTEHLKEQGLLVNAFGEAFRKKVKNIRDKKFPIDSVVDVANDSEAWTEIFEGFKTTLYATISRARLAVVIIGDPMTLELIWEVLGDRCERLFIDEI